MVDLDFVWVGFGENTRDSGAPQFPTELLDLLVGFFDLIRLNLGSTTSRAFEVLKFTIPSGKILLCTTLL